MEHAPVVVLASDRAPALDDALDGHTLRRPASDDAAVHVLRTEPVGAVVCHAADANWERIGAVAREQTPCVPVFVLTSGDPTPREITATGATPFYAGDDWNWPNALAAQVEDAARDYRVRVEHDQTREHHEQLLETAPVPITIIGPDMVVRRANEAAAGLLGYDDPREMEDRQAIEFVHEDYSEETGERLRQVVEDRIAAPPLSLELLDANGEPIRVLSATSPTRLDGEPAAQAILPPDEPYETRRELARNKQKIEAIHTVAVDLENAETAREVCERTVAAAEEILAFDICVIDSVRDGYFHVEAASENLPEENVAHSPADTGVLGDAYQRGETVITRDIVESDVADPQGPYQSALSIPLGEWGAFQAAATEPGAFDEEDAELGEILISHAHVAVERIERQQEIKQRERAFSALHDATRMMAQAESNQEVVEHAVSAARNTLDLPLTTAFEHDPDTTSLRPIAVTSETRDLFGTVPDLTKGVSPGYDAFESGEPKIHHDLRDVDGVVNPDTVVRSEMLLPLGEYGLLVCSDTEGFDDVDVSAAQVLAANTTTVLERVAREEELKGERERLDEFASVVAHDLQNPLNHASGFLELARETGDAEYLERVDANLSQMSRLVTDVLTLARQGEVIGTTTPVEFSSAVESAWRPLSDGDAALSAPESGVMVTADRERLVELLGNLFENAQHHVGPDVSVTVGTVPDGFFVEDDGPGIPEDDRSDVFTHGYSTSADGTGFGLSIVKRIANAHGWTVTVTKGTMGGARFEFRGVTLSGEDSTQVA